MITQITTRDATEPMAAADVDWPTMAAEAYHGLASRIVETIAPQSEADPVGASCCSTAPRWATVLE